MKHEDSFKLIELMIKMGYPANLIMLTLEKCAYGKAIGPAFVDAWIDYRENLECKTDTPKSAQATVT